MMNTDADPYYTDTCPEAAGVSLHAAVAFVSAGCALKSQPSDIEIEAKNSRPCILLPHHFY